MKTCRFDTPTAYRVRRADGRTEVFTACREDGDGYAVERRQVPFGTERGWLPRGTVERVEPIWD